MNRYSNWYYTVHSVIYRTRLIGRILIIIMRTSSTLWCPPVAAAAAAAIGTQTIDQGLLTRAHNSFLRHSRHHHPLPCQPATTGPSLSRYCALPFAFIEPNMWLDVLWFAAERVKRGVRPSHLPNTLNGQPPCNVRWPHLVLLCPTLPTSFAKSKSSAATMLMPPWVLCVSGLTCCCTDHLTYTSIHWIDVFVHHLVKGRKHAYKFDRALSLYF